MPIALITGASSGIGWHLSHELGRRGYQLILVARRFSLLQKLSETLQANHLPPPILIPVDLSLPDSIETIRQALAGKEAEIQVLVNNAAVGYHGLFTEVDGTKAEEMIQTNLQALTKLTRLVLPGMLKRKEGYVLNVASTSGMQPVPSMAVYAASKAFVVSFTRALALEYAGSGVHLTVLCPGPVATEFAQKANMAEANLANTPVMEVLSPEAVAQAGVTALFNYQLVCIPGWRNRIIMRLSRCLPTTWVTYLADRFMRKRLKKTT